MAEERKCAILDADFVSKANIIKAENSVLADEVLEFPGYQFFCHQKMKEELGDHGTGEAQLWLEKKIASGEITCYSDGQIITEMREMLHGFCYDYYRSFLKQGCDLFDIGFYARYFMSLDEWLEKGEDSTEAFLAVLCSCEDEIGHQKSYGEVKAFVLVQVLRLLYGMEAYIFCSDDFGARQGFANGAQIPCISILSVFLKMWLIGKKMEEVQPFFQSLVHWCTNRENPQTHVRVWVFREGSYKRERMPLASILQDIYAGLYCARKNGDLQRIT